MANQFLGVKIKTASQMYLCFSALAPSHVARYVSVSDNGRYVKC